MSEDGRVRHFRGIDEKLVEREVVAIAKGKCVLIRAGPHAGFTARIADDGPATLRLKLSINQTVCFVPPRVCVSNGAAGDIGASRRRARHLRGGLQVDRRAARRGGRSAATTSCRIRYFELMLEAPKTAARPASSAHSEEEAPYQPKRKAAVGVRSDLLPPMPVSRGCTRTSACVSPATASRAAATTM